MGLFDKLFQSRPINPSYIQAWAQEHLDLITNAKEVTTKILFTSLIYALVKYFYEDKLSFSKKKDAKALDCSDAVLFEVGCYSIFRINSWLNENFREFNEQITGGFSEEFSLLFKVALNDVGIPGLFVRRLAQYVEVTRPDGGLDTYHFHLEQLILRTRDNRVCGDYSFDNSPVILADAFQTMDIKTLVAGWEFYFDAILKAVEYYCQERKKTFKSGA